MSIEKMFCPVTPRGTVLFLLKARSEDEAWFNVIVYEGKNSNIELKAEGYKVVEISNDNFSLRSS